jgi:hypothetical protein
MTIILLTAYLASAFLVYFQFVVFDELEWRKLNLFEKCMVTIPVINTIFLLAQFVEMLRELIKPPKD